MMKVVVMVVGPGLEGLTNTAHGTACPLDGISMTIVGFWYSFG